MNELFSKLGLAVVAVAGALLFAAPQQASAGEGPNLGNVSVSFGFDIVTEYWFRGFLQEDDGFIIQPWGEVGISVPEAAESLGVDDVYFFVGVWASVHDEETGASKGNDGDAGFYEFDLYGGAGIVIGNWDLSFGYVTYIYPSSASGDIIEEISFAVAYDDSSLWGESLGGGFALYPYFMIAIEVNNTFADDEFIYGELGIEPSFVIVESEDMPVTLSIPVTLGFSIDDYYSDENGDEEFFGFFSVGAMVSVPLAFIPAEYGAWDFGGGVIFLFANEDNSSEDDAVIGVISISMGY